MWKYVYEFFCVLEVLVILKNAMFMNPFVFCSYSYTKECFPQVTANMMATIAVPDLSSNSERKRKKKTTQSF